MITPNPFLLPLREKVDRVARRMRGLPNVGSASRSTIPLTRQPSAAALSLKGRGMNSGIE
jgi:hypothetical protein